MTSNERRFVEIVGNFPNKEYGGTSGTFDATFSSDEWEAIELFVSAVYSTGVANISQINISAPVTFPVKSRFSSNGSGAYQDERRYPDGYEES